MKFGLNKRESKMDERFLIFFLFWICATACRPNEMVAGTTAVSSPTPTISQTVTTAASPTAITETPTRHLTRTPRPIPTHYPTAFPTVTPPPSIDMAALVEQLALKTVDGVNGRSLIQLYVSEYGLRRSRSPRPCPKSTPCAGRPTGTGLLLSAKRIFTSYHWTLIHNRSKWNL